MAYAYDLSLLNPYLDKCNLYVDVVGCDKMCICVQKYQE
jgi:hypothetical protein